MSKTNTQQPKRGRSLLEWTYSEGPPRRSWQWYVANIAIGLGLAGLLFVAYHDTTAPALSMVLWLCIVVAYSLAPSREYLAQLDGHVLYIWDIKRNRAIAERNLNEFATYAVDVYPRDRLNPDTHRLVLRRRDGRGTVEIKLSEDERLQGDALERVAQAVPAAPEVDMSLVQRVNRFAQRWFGWR